LWYLFTAEYIDTSVNFSDGVQTFEVPFYVAKIQEFTDTITCVAVPLFFLISGFYFT
jgi:surface polysaccharide O-acyltransferase-like enzyme